MAPALRHQRHLNERGQTTLEYLLLMAFVALAAYIVVQGPIAVFTDQMLGQIRGAIGNIVQNAEVKAPVLGPGQAGHPGDPARLKPLHL